MAFCELKFYGKSLDKQTAANVIIPAGKGPFPVLYLLHGLSDEHTMWNRRTSIERYVEKLPLIVVMPDGGRSFYCNDPQPGGLAYEDHMVKDVVELIDTTFHTIPKRTARAIAGLSMGGYGATMLAMRHPDVYSVAVSHSGALWMKEKTNSDSKPLQAFIKSLGKNYHDPGELARKLKPSRSKVAYRFDCGMDDFLIEHNRQFHAFLEKIGYPHEYVEHAGAHNWEYWDLHIQDTLKFVMKNLKT